MLMGDRTEEMKPEWFALGKVPYGRMWEESKFWLPPVLRGEREGEIVFHHVEFSDEWDGITRRVEEWVGLEDGHGGREGGVGKQALGWVERVRGVVRD